MYKSILNPALFCYSHAEIVALASGAIATPQINISNDSDFEVFEIRAVNLGAGLFTAGLFIQLSLASGELFSNVALDVMSFSSSSQAAGGLPAFSGYPIRLPANTRIPANSTINIQVNNTTGQTIDFQLQLWGYKVEKQNG